MEDQVVGAAVLQQGPVVVPSLIGWENSENVKINFGFYIALEMTLAE